MCALFKLWSRTVSKYHFFLLYNVGAWVSCGGEENVFIGSCGWKYVFMMIIEGKECVFVLTEKRLRASVVRTTAC